MSSPSGKRRPLSTSGLGYEPLGGKPKPPPKPKAQLLKSYSSAESKSDPPGKISGGYFQPGGVSSIGYCLSSVYKTKLNPKMDSEWNKSSVDGSSNYAVSTKSQVSKPNFMPQDNARPPISSLPAKFRVSFEERNRQSTSQSDISEPATGILVAISEPAPRLRRPPPAPPISGSSLNRRMSNPLPSNYVKKPLITRLSNDNISTATPINNKSEIKCPKNCGLDNNSKSSIHTHISSITSTTATQFSNQMLKSPSSPKNPVTFAQPPPREMEYIEREHPRKAFECLEKLWQKEELCDAILIANGKELKAHRVVLASCSQYFESMFIGEFAEPPGEPVVIEEVNDDALEAMINFAYTSHIKLTERNIYSLFEAADILQFNGVKAACFKFFKQQINKSNCIRTWLFAESHNCTELLDASLKYVECNFLDIVRGKEFLDVDQPDVITGITSREDLAITSEEQVYEAVLSWVQHKLHRRKNCALEVFKSVRFPSMSRDYLMYIVDNESLIKDDPDLLQLLIDALESHVTMMRGTLKKKKEGDSSMKPRAASMAVEVVNIDKHDIFLGLRIMGGTDRPQHVFRQGDKPGVFILKILEEGAAAKVGKLRTGDRILKANDTDMTKVTHEEAIRNLKTCSYPLSLLIRHEPPPAGLKELTLVTKVGEGFGFVIAGGVNGYPGNPLDETDEGIFISQIIPGGAAEQDGRLKVGTRILQVNSVSLLGKTHEEALKVLQGVLDRINLLVCDGYDPDSISQTINIAGMEYLETLL